MNMYGKVLLSLLVTALVPLLLVAFFTYQSSQKTFRTMAGSTLEASALTVARNAVTMVEYAVKEMESWTGLETLQDVFTGDDMDLRIATMLRDLQSNSDFSEIWCTDTNGKIVASNNYDRIGQYVGEQEAVIAALSGTEYVSPVRRFQGIPSLDRPAICMALPLVGAFDGETLIGTVVAFYDWDHVQDRVSFQERIAPQEGMHLFLVDGEHRIIAQGGARAPLVALLEGELPVLHRDNASRTHAVTEGALDGSRALLVMDTIAGKYPHVMYTGVAVAPEQIILKPVRRLALLTMLACLAATAGTLVLAQFLSRRLSRPITALSNTAREIAGGNLTLAPPLLAGGEIGQLAADLDRMRLSLKAQIDTLDSSVRERTRQLEATVEQLQEEIQKKEHAQREASVREQQLRQADKMVSLGVLVSGVAHEINNPNGLIGLNLGLLADTWEKALPVLERYYEEHGDFSLGAMNFSEIREQMPVLLADTAASSERIRAIVDDLKGFSRTSDERLDEAVDLNHTVRAAINLASTYVKKATENLVVELAPDLPPIRGNERRLEQVVINLLLNACDALESSEATIRIVTRVAGPTVVVEIIDAGCGIAAADLPHITDPFFTTRRNEGGTGLGLPISAGIVEEHGGALEFASEVGRGTTARIVLPLPPDGALP